MKTLNRWWVVGGGILIQLCLGAIYAWSAFTAPLTLTVKPYRYIPHFSAAQLRISQEAWQSVRDQIAPLQEQRESLERRIADSASAENRAEMASQLERLDEEIAEVIFATVPRERIERLLFGFSKTRTQIIFLVGLLAFAVVMALVAGPWQKKAGPRKVAIAGGLVLGAGYVLAGLSGNSFWGILLGVGVLGGAGIGLGYVCPIAALVKWFPDKKGLITGLAVAGFGFGALIWIKLTSGFKFGPVDLTPGWAGLYGMGWTVSNVFILYGILFAVLVVLGSPALVNPPAGWTPTGWTPPAAAKAATTGGVNFGAAQMVRTPQFWIVFLTFLVGATAGLMVIGVIQLFGRDALTASGIEAAQANTIAGTAMGLFYSLLNGFGRIIWGSASDRLGRKNAIALMCLLQGVIMIVFYFIGGREWGIYLAAAVIGFNFGGNFALFPAITADYFGNANVGTNYPWVFMSYGVGGVVGPILGGIMGDAKAWMWAFIPAGAACLLMALVVGALLRPPAAQAST